METTKNNNSFWEQYSYTIAFLICLMLLVVSAFFPAMAYIALVVFMLSACLFDANKTFGLLFLFLFCEIVTHSYLFTAFAFVFGFGTMLFKAIKAKRIKWKKSLIIPLVCIGIIFIMCTFVHNITQEFTIAPFRYPIIMLALLAVHILKDEFDIKVIFRYFYVALFATCAFGVIFIFPNPSGIFSYLSDEFGYFRYQGLTGHPNTLYAYPLCAIGVGMYLYFKNRINIWEFLFVSSICIILGYITWSKAFLILIVICFLLFFFCSFKKGSNYVFVEIFIFAIASAIAYLLFKDQIIKLFDRFFLYFTDGNIINMLTTGRYDIWIYYTNMWTESFSNIFFGIGANFVDFADFENALNYVHNAYLDILVKFGILGTLVICTFIGFLIYTMPKKGLRFINFLPLIIVLLNMADEEFISSKIIVLLVAIICLFDTQDNQTEEFIATNSSNDNIDTEINSAKKQEAPTPTIKKASVDKKINSTTRKDKEILKGKKNKEINQPLKSRKRISNN